MRSTRSPFNDSAGFHADVSLPQILERPVASVTRDMQEKRDDTNEHDPKPARISFNEI